MNQIQTAILQLLQAQAMGRNSAINVDQIYTTLTAQNHPIIAGRTQEHVRQAVRSMVKNHNQLIGTRIGFAGRGGYYIITNRDEAIETIMDLVSRSHKMLERVQSLKSEWNSQNPDNRIIDGSYLHLPHC